MDHPYSGGAGASKAEQVTLTTPHGQPSRMFAAARIKAINRRAISLPTQSDLSPHPATNDAATDGVRYL